MRIVAMILWALSMAGEEPSLRIARARTLLAAGDCLAATAELQSARNDSAAIDARVMVHFYSAVAFSTCGNEAKARDELIEFFRLRPGHSELDASKFDPAFVRLFNDTSNEGGRRSIASIRDST